MLNHKLFILRNVSIIVELWKQNCGVGVVESWFESFLSHSFHRKSFYELTKFDKFSNDTLTRFPSLRQLRHLAHPGYRKCVVLQNKLHLESPGKGSLSMAKTKPSTFVYQVWAQPRIVMRAEGWNGNVWHPGVWHNFHCRSPWINIERGLLVSFPARTCTPCYVMGRVALGSTNQG